FAALGPPVPNPAASTLGEQSGVLAAWVELGPGGVALARVVTDRTTCPSAVLNGQAQPMQVRAAPSAAYAVLVCEPPIPHGPTLAPCPPAVRRLRSRTPCRWGTCSYWSSTTRQRPTMIHRPTSWPRMPRRWPRSVRLLATAPGSWSTRGCA